MKKVSSIIWGFILIAAGIIFALNAFDITKIDIFFDGWWTLLIIIPCAIGIFTEKDRTGNIIGLILGVFLLLCCQNILSFSMLWKLAVPLIIIYIGFKMIFGGFFNNKSSEISKKISESGAKPRYGTAIFSGCDMRPDGEIFDGAELNAVFGGVECDLTNAVFNKDCVIKAYAIFGGVDIILPEHINVKVNSNSIFGGTSSKKHINSKSNEFTVYINTVCLFGGVEIK